MTENISLFFFLDGLETNSAYNKLVRYKKSEWLEEFDALVKSRSFKGYSDSGIPGIGSSIPDSLLDYRYVGVQHEN